MLLEPPPIAFRQEGDCVVVYVRTYCVVGDDTLGRKVLLIFIRTRSACNMFHVIMSEQGNNQLCCGLCTDLLCCRRRHFRQEGDFVVVYVRTYCVVGDDTFGRKVIVLWFMYGPIVL